MATPQKLTLTVTGRSPEEKYTRCAKGILKENILTKSKQQDETNLRT